MRQRRRNSIYISDDYYDLHTHTLLFDRLTDEEKKYINQNTEENITTFLFKRWRMIIISFPNNYYSQYYSKKTPGDRNEWFKKYLDYPTKNISEMPDVL